MAVEDIQALARKCAESDLNMRESRYLFDALYVTDAIMLAGGNSAKAARRAGVGREALFRMQKRGTIDLPEVENE
jgi:DNA-binding NtrC family response regulator